MDGPGGGSEPPFWSYFATFKLKRLLQAKADQAEHAEAKHHQAGWLRRRNRATSIGIETAVRDKACARNEVTVCIEGARS